MRLINKKTKQPLVEIQQERVHFYSDFLEKEMQVLGIEIPHGLQVQYGGKTHIMLGDPLFTKAFQEVYCVHYMDSTQFRWEMQPTS